MITHIAPSRWLSMALLIWVVIPARAANQAPSPDLQARALRIMEDIVPHEPVSPEQPKVAFDDCHALWGKLFGDDQIASLVAVEPSGNSRAKKPVEADLCLLLWQSGWTFRQRIGKVGCFRGKFEVEDWVIKQHKPTGRFYVLNHLDLNHDERRESWLCDPASHQLVPTHWPQDALSSLSGNTITFTRWRPGGPIVRTIHRFNGQPREEIIAITEEYSRYHVLTATLTLTEPKTGKVTTWKVRPKGREDDPHHDPYLLYHQDGKTPAEAFEESAVIDFAWDKEYGDKSASRYLFHRLTGLGIAAYEGQWDQDEKRVLLMPVSATVTGLPEAIEMFSLSPSK